MIPGIVEAVAVGMLFAALAWAVSDMKLSRSPLSGPFLAVIATGIASSAASAAPGRSWARVTVIAAGIGVYYVAFDHPRLSRHVLRWSAWLLVAAVVAGALAGDRRPGGLLHNPNTAGSAIALLLPEFYGVWPLGYIPLMLTSRGALLASLAMELDWHRAGKLLIGVLILLLVAVVLILARLRTVENRLYTWTEAVGLFAQRPVMGWGPGTYGAMTSNKGGRHADSLPLTIAAEGGLLGLVAWGWLAVAVLREIARSYDPMRRGVLAWMLHQAVDCTVFSPVVLLLLAISLAEVVRETGTVGAEIAAEHVSEPSTMAVTAEHTARVFAPRA